MSRVYTTDQPDRVLGRVALALRDIKLAHSVFALPFAVLGAFLVVPRVAGGGVDWGRFGVALLLVVVCMVCARTWAMLVNRLADRRLDAANPRTAGRAFARGALRGRDGVLMLVASGGAFVACCALFGVLRGNWWPAILSVPVLVWIGFYSYTKRFTWLCHLFLGGALAASPVAAAIAVQPGAVIGAHAVWFVAAMVLLWVGGFDVIYALSDMEHDRGAGLYSVAARFGWRGAAWISRGHHVLAVGALAGAMLVDQRLGVLFGGGVAIVALLLVWEHAVLARRGREGIPVAFFTINGAVSVVLGVAGCVDVLI